jgi:drug/metabolite transporter (DMT)-like permease
MTTLQSDSSVESPSLSQSSQAKSGNLQSIGILLTSVAFGAVGQLTLKAGMNSVSTNSKALQLSVDTLLRMATNPLLLLGIAIFGVSTLLWLLALSKADLSFAYPFLSLTYTAVLIGGAVLFHESITIPRVIGFAIIISGVWVVSRSEPKKKT